MVYRIDRMESNKKAIYDVPRNSLHPQHQQRKDDCPTLGRFHIAFPFQMERELVSILESKATRSMMVKSRLVNPHHNLRIQTARGYKAKYLPWTRKMWKLLHLLLKLLYAITVLMSGSTHSSGCPKFVYNSYVSSDTMSHVLVVSTLVEDTILSDHVYRSYSFSTEGHELSINLIVWDIQDFDAILGIDWLSAYHGKLVCFHNFLTFYLSEGHVVWFIGVKPSSPIVISAIRAVDCWNRDMKLFSLRRR